MIEKMRSLLAGRWMIKAEYFQIMLDHVNAGTFAPAESRHGGSMERGFTMGANGVAVIEIRDHLMKSFSWWGTSTFEVRQALREALNDDGVKSIMLLIDSPGGEVAGNKVLADDIATASTIKPVHAHIEDIGASAAYWLASQANTITANDMALIGSIGTVAGVVDSSKAFEEAGLKMFIVSTGDFKGAFFPGSEITDAQLEDLQAEINALNEFFLEAVSRGRSMSMDDLLPIADGRVFLAAEALSLGLIDGIATFDEVMIGMGNGSSVTARKTKVETALPPIESAKHKKKRKKSEKDGEDHEDDEDDEDNEDHEDDDLDEPQALTPRLDYVNEILRD